MSMVQSSRNLATSLSNPNLATGATVDLGSLLASNPAVQGTALQMLSAIKNFQIGIGPFIHPNWNSPRTISLTLLELPGSTKAPRSVSTDVIIVAVLPYQGAASLLITTSK